VVKDQIKARIKGGAKRREEKVRKTEAMMATKELPKEKVAKERTRKITIITTKKIMKIKRAEIKGREIRCRKVHKTNSGVST